MTGRNRKHDDAWSYVVAALANQINILIAAETLYGAPQMSSRELCDVVDYLQENRVPILKEVIRTIEVMDTIEKAERRISEASFHPCEAHALGRKH